jgi:hypothetical protein
VLARLCLELLACVATVTLVLQLETSCQASKLVSPQAAWLQCQPMTSFEVAEETTADAAGTSIRPVDDHSVQAGC